jgi:hypothetical protein
MYGRILVMTDTPLYRLVELRLGRSLAGYVGERRAAGEDWRSIVREIGADAGVEISRETLRSWFVQVAQ